MLIDELLTGTSKYRYLITMSRLVGANGRYSRIDASKGQVLIQESAPFSPNGQDTDYTLARSINPIGEMLDTRNGSSLQQDEIRSVAFNVKAPTDDTGRLTGRAWTHYSIYRTEDINDPLVDAGTVTGTFIWSNDIPIVRQFRFEAIVLGDDNTTSTIFIEEDDTERFTQSDLGATITLLDGTNLVIAEVLNSRMAYVTEGGQVPPAITTPFWGSIGGGSQLILENDVQVDRFITEYEVTSASITFPKKDIVGQEIIFRNGELGIVKYLRYGNTGEVICGVYLLNGTPQKVSGTLLSGVINPTGRVLNDITADDTLRARKESGEPLFFLETRFFSPLPNGKLSAVVGGAYFTAPYKNSEYYYCSLRSLFRAGYYHQGFQYNAKPVGSITRLKEYPNTLSIFGRNHTYYLDPTIIQNAGESRVGEYIPVFTDPRLITDRIGVFTEGNSAKIDNGGEVILTNEPAVRFFDGYKYSDNIADGKVQNTRIASFLHSVVMAWNSRRGLKITGLAKSPRIEIESKGSILVYYGESNSTSLTGSGIKGLRAKIGTDTFVGTYKFLAGGYNYICYPSEWGSSIQIEDNVNGMNIAYPNPMFTIVSVDGVDYNVLRTSNILNGVIDFLVKEI